MDFKYIFTLTRIIKLSLGEQHRTTLTRLQLVSHLLILSFPSPTHIHNPLHLHASSLFVRLVMPKKRKHQTQYSKPPSVAPPSLSLSSSSQGPSDSHGRSVNEILASLRRSTLTADNAHYAAFLPQTSPSVPPPLRTILSIPETPEIGRAHV